MSGRQAPTDLPEGVPPLERIYFYLTEGCNMACRHCWLAPPLDPDGTRRPALPVETFRRILVEAKPLGLAAVKLTGGEPLLHPAIGEILGIVGAEGLDLVVETNGALLTPAIASMIAAVPGRSVSVSIDGADAATHDGVRGVAGSFEAACRAVRLLAAAGTPPQVIMTLLGENAGQVDAVVRLAEGLGASSVKFNLAQPTGRGEALRRGGGLPTVRQLLALGRHVDGDLAKRTSLELYFDYPPAFRPLHRIARAGGDAVCGILGILGVLPSGEYALCGIGRQVPELVFGRAGSDDLGEVWLRHPVLRNLREDLAGELTGVCSRCLMRGRCLGHCVAQNYFRSGSLRSPFWFCERAEEEGLFPASRIGIPLATV